MASQKLLAFSVVLCAAVAGAKSAQTAGFKYIGGSGNGGCGQSSFKINWNSNSSYQNKCKNGVYFHQQYAGYRNHRRHIETANILQRASLVSAVKTSLEIEKEYDILVLNNRPDAARHAAGPC